MTHTEECALTVKRIEAIRKRLVAVDGAYCATEKELNALCNLARLQVHAQDANQSLRDAQTPLEQGEGK